MDFLFSFQFVLFTLSVVPNPVSRTPVCGEKQETTRSVGGRSLPGHPCGLLRQTNWYTRFQYIWFCYTDEGYSFIFGLYYNLEIKNTPSVPTVSRHRPTPTLEVTSLKDESRGLHRNAFHFSIALSQCQALQRQERDVERCDHGRFALLYGLFFMKTK